MKIIVLPRVQQEARMVTPLIRWAEPQAATIRSLRNPKHGGYFRKAMVSVSLGLFFGLFAGIGFYAVQQGTGMFTTSTDTAVVDEITSEATTESTQSAQLATNVTYVESDVSNVVEKVMPAMVSIVNNFTETANVFGQQYTQEEAASGSGIIVGKTDDELLIVSNNHVVESADTLTVTFIDGSEAQAQVKGTGFRYGSGSDRSIFK